MTVSPVASSEKIQTALTNLGTPDGFLAYDVVPLLQQLVVALGNITSGGGSGSGAITGEGKLWFTDVAPTGWLLCDGTAISRTTYADLFAVIGTTYGSGDGVNTFNIPDFSGRVPAGIGGSAFNVLGYQLGNESVTLDANNLPSLATATSSAVSGGDFAAVTGVSFTGTPLNSVDIIQPSLVVNFIIKT